MQIGKIVYNKFQTVYHLWKDPQSTCAKLEIYGFESNCLDADKSNANLHAFTLS